MKSVKKYIWNLLISIDQLVNTIFGGDPDETISSRLGKLARAGKHKEGFRRHVYNLIYFITELFEKDHFENSIEEDEGKDQSAKD